MLIGLQRLLQIGAYEWIKAPHPPIPADGSATKIQQSAAASWLGKLLLQKTDGALAYLERAVN
jgi:hypothetical protein